MLLITVTENVIDTIPVQTLSTTLTWILGVSIGQFLVIISLVIYIFTDLKSDVKNIKASITTEDNTLKTELNAKIDKKANTEKVDGNYENLLEAIKTTNSNVERLLPPITSVARIEGKLDGAKEIIKEVTPR
jgi:hypothetical protein